MKKRVVIPFRRGVPSKSAPPARDRGRVEEAREIVKIVGLLIDRIDRACVRYGCSRAELFASAVEGQRR
jgi:hypothetical protein